MYQHEERVVFHTRCAAAAEVKAPVVSALWTGLTKQLACALGRYKHEGRGGGLGYEARRVIKVHQVPSPFHSHVWLGGSCLFLSTLPVCWLVRRALLLIKRPTLRDVLTQAALRVSASLSPPSSSPRQKCDRKRRGSWRELGLCRASPWVWRPLSWSSPVSARSPYTWLWATTWVQPRYFGFWFTKIKVARLWR